MRAFDRLIEAAKTGVATDVRAIIERHPRLINKRDRHGATPLHHAAFGGHRQLAQLLVQLGADINAIDEEFGATPAGWAIEYLREIGGFLGIELADLSYAIERGHVEWVARFLKRFPALREARDPQGRPFKLLAQHSGNLEILRLFTPDITL
ncbi:MAG: ankyrin repeat domain-containing protein [Terracidiphilus sp.]|jgi:ankyrin repeat protein